MGRIAHAGLTPTNDRRNLAVRPQEILASHVTMNDTRVELPQRGIRQGIIPAAAQQRRNQPRVVSIRKLCPQTLAPFLRGVHRQTSIGNHAHGKFMDSCKSAAQSTRLGRRHLVKIQSTPIRFREHDGAPILDGCKTRRAHYVERQIRCTKLLEKLRSKRRLCFKSGRGKGIRRIRHPPMAPARINDSSGDEVIVTHQGAAGANCFKPIDCCDG